MADLICCRECCSPSCRGCNVKTLDDLLESGVLDKFMDEHNTIRKEKIVNTAPVVRGEWKIDCTGAIYCCVCGYGGMETDYCPHCGAKMDGVKDATC